MTATKPPRKPTKPRQKPTKPRQIPATHLIPALSIPRDFTINEVPFQPNAATLEVEKPPPLGPLAAFKNTFTGRGFNTIFRPQNSSTPTDLPIPQPGSDNILELNLTIESLSFSDPLGSVPNRGREQRDIFLNGVPYLQTISDVTDPTQTTPIHFEPGLWVIVEATTDPAQPKQTLARMASIPHGTTINAQGTFFTVAGGPHIDTVDITPFPIDHPENRIDFPSQTVTNTGTARIPQDLSVAPAITQRLLKDPNTLLSDHIAGLTILFTDVIRIDTKNTAEPGGGTDNIGFLVGDAAGPNADAVEISATFWIETVQAEIKVGPSNAGESQTVSPAVPAGAPAPKFAVTSASAITKKQSITVTYPQIQYTQNVSLNFATLTWPHVSVATLVPSDPIAVETHVVQPGDTLSGIAEQFGVSLGALEAANPQITNPDLIFPGQVIRIPANVVTYVVQPGDTLSGIAERFGVSLGALEAANPQITNPDLINPGQVIKIP
jgi:spore coat assembly protein SafA